MILSRTTEFVLGLIGGIFGFGGTFFALAFGAVDKAVSDSAPQRSFSRPWQSSSQSSSQSSAQSSARSSSSSRRNLEGCYCSSAASESSSRSAYSVCFPLSCWSRRSDEAPSQGSENVVAKRIGVSLAQSAGDIAYGLSDTAKGTHSIVQ